MKFEPKTGQRPTEFAGFAEGVHEATIARATLKHTKEKNLEMIALRIVGQDEESGFYNVVLGDELGEESLNYLLTSIMDNGHDIPEGMNWGWNQETIEFLTKKPVYIEVKNQTYNGKTSGAVKRILNQEEFDAFFDEE